ncbi:MAG: methyltransferase [Oscillospiraceae bacterium]
MKNEAALPENCTIEMLAQGTAVYVSDLHRFGTDAMLLSHFCNVHRNETACDLGTGCGIIPLRWLDAGHKGKAVAVELDPEGTALLLKSIEKNKANNITAVNADLREFKANGQFDVVCCNPPYFIGGFVSQKEGRAQQRHQITCTTADVCMAGARLLKDRGRLCLCQRPEMMAEVMAHMKTNGIEPKKLRFVRQSAEDLPWLVLIDGRKNGGTGLVMMPDLIVGNGTGGFSDELLKIYGKI